MREVVCALALLVMTAGFWSKLHPDLLMMQHPPAMILHLLASYPCLAMLGVLLAGPAAAVRLLPKIAWLGIAGAVTGLPLWLLFASLSLRQDFLLWAILLQILTIPWLLPLKNPAALARISRFVQFGILGLAVVWMVLSLGFAALIRSDAERIAGASPYCLSAPTLFDIYGGTALSPATDMMLFQRVMSYPIDFYYVRHRLELSVFEADSTARTYHWSVKNGQFEEGGHLTPIEACRAHLRSPNPR